MIDGKDKGLSIDQCFCMATLGGGRACGPDHQTGNFMVGKEIDDCPIRTCEHGGEYHDTHEDAGGHTEVDLKGPLGVMAPVGAADLQMIFEKFVMSADDTNIIARVWVSGKCTK